MKTFLLILLLLVAVVVIWYISTYNGFQKRKVSVREAYATIDVYLRKRYDLIPNLVSIAKGYAAHEAATLEAVVAARGRAMNSEGAQRVVAEQGLSQALGRVIMLAEAYPELQADGQFRDLQRQLQEVETEVERARRYYNGVVSEHNQKRVMIPASIVAKMAGILEEPFFDAAFVEYSPERQNVKVEF